MTDIVFTARNFTLSQKEQEYIARKISKHERLLEAATSISVVAERNGSHSREDKRFKLEFLISMPHAFIKVSDRGSELDALADQLEVVLKRRLTRYHDSSQRWENQTPWRAEEIDRQLEPHVVTEPEQYTDYVPEIRRKQYEDESPLHPAEAVERMELLGYNCFLFKNMESGKYAMLYKREAGGYGLVEPKNG
ncbi:MAG: putative sigma-54 modulation protein [candidate division WS6 bacterium OLB20]|uniref:Putative sigma-54 modulation protein n=1 Tax=candidate division WS6 bacterium OLB20 TaxID=1617426 RepID=A0A136LX62_9BACT|nr:MAG: putative sigma-54 modulation protein [candidate division WS6 bacterium OLB20]